MKEPLNNVLRQMPTVCGRVFDERRLVMKCAWASVREKNMPFREAVKYCWVELKKACGKEKPTA